MQKIIFKSENELLDFFRMFKGKTLYELKNSLSEEAASSINVNKGYAGQIFEVLTGRRPNNSEKPDIEELGIELKALPLKEVRNEEFVSKERSKLKSINYVKMLSDDWSTAYLRTKIDKILFNVYLHPDGYRFDEIKNLIFLDSFIFNLNDRAEKKFIIRDWEKLKNEISSLKAHSL